MSASTTVRLLVVGSLMVLACGESKPQRETITLGALLDASGSLANYGVEALNAAKLAAMQINSAGGVLGKDLKIENRDPALNAERAKTLATDLVGTGVPAILGSIASGVTLSAAEVTIASKVILISGASTSPALTSVADNGYLFRTCGSDAPQGALVAKRARAKGFTKVAVIYVPGPYGQELAEAFSSAFTSQGGAVTDKVAYEVGQSSYINLLAGIYSHQPEAVFLVAYPEDGATIVNNYLQSPPSGGLSWFFSNGLADAVFVSEVGANRFTFNHEGTSPSVATGAQYDVYANAYTTSYGIAPNPGNYSAQMFDAVYILALAMEKAGAADASLMKDQIAAVSAAPGDTFNASDYAAAVAAVKAGKDINYEGASGAVDIDAAGDASALSDVWKVEDGALVYPEKNLSP